MRVPKLGAAPAVITVLAFLDYRYRAGAAKRLNTYLTEDGGRTMFSDFASAQPFEDDQFRLGRHFLFIKNGAVLSICLQNSGELTNEDLC